MVARKRFELLSRAPEAPMLDHYTTGLQTQTETSFSIITLTLRCRFVFFGFSDAVAFLADFVVVVAVPERVHDWVLVFRVAG